MSESMLSLDLSALRSEVAYFLGKGRDEYGWSDKDVEIFDSHIRSGLRMFYNPLGHVWSFFKPFLTLQLSSGIHEYMLPDDFGFSIGDIICHTEDDSRRWGIRQISSHEMMRVVGKKTGRPICYAIVPVAPTLGNGQRFSILLHPTPDEQLELTLQYSVVPNNISTLNPYPYGGAMHSETIKEAVLSKAEADTEDGSIGVHAQAYQERLAASIQYDKNLMLPDNIGNNPNGHCRRICFNRHEVHFF